MDAVTIIVAAIIIVIANWIVSYFVTKNAIKNALIEDRRFQRKVKQAQAAAPRDVWPSQPRRCRTFG
ncbi:hypothetical protein [Microbacterium binotii]|uniref:hypothetical protein n=1 Tax=Microbacterium binotii TaxID=462710 RepID=UPI001F357E76|nr:hypothetical protein [Microbacterium binotii]UIN30929.1 hypothetical protein LXM64_01600 [Microbacterium binotii]